MERIRKISVNEKEEWNRIVRSFEDYEVFFMNEYVTAFMEENRQNGIPILLLYENGDDRAINVVFERDVSEDIHFQGKLEKNRYYDIISPYGYGGFWGTVKDYSTLNAEYIKYCNENHYICEFVRFNLFSHYSEYYPGEVETRTHNVVRSLEMPMDEIWMDFKQKVRKNVKRANTYGLEIIIDDSGKYMDDFLKIYYGTMDRSDAEKQFYFKGAFFEKIMSMSENAIMFHVQFEGKIISTELVIYGTKNCYSYLGGTNSEYFYTRANDFLKFEIIRWGIEKGLSNFVLGGGYGIDDGIYQYKLNFAPHGVKEFYIGRNIFDNDAYEMLIEKRSREDMSILDSNFFPKYRVG